MKNKSFFWASYSDLMTSLFFVMLLLFVTTVTMMYIHEKATEEELAKIKELEGSVQAIDQHYFAYNEEFKKHVLKIEVKYDVYSADISRIPKGTQYDLVEAGKKIREFVDSVYNKYNSPFLIVVEGQSSKGPYWRNVHENNDVLSYERALALVGLWESKGINLRSDEYSKKCELLICGSGDRGVMRVQPDDKYNEKNQRFLIHVIPKPGIVNSKNEDK